MRPLVAGEEPLSYLRSMGSDSDFASASTLAGTSTATALETARGSSHETGRGLLAGTTLAGRYDVIDLLGEGGMGEVYRLH